MPVLLSADAVTRLASWGLRHISTRNLLFAIADWRVIAAGASEATTSSSRYGAKARWVGRSWVRPSTTPIMSNRCGDLNQISISCIS